MTFILSIAIIVLIAFAQCTDVFAYSIKGMQGTAGRQAIGLANLLNFVSRIFYMSAIVIISVLFEIYHLGDALLTIVGIGFFCSAIFCSLLALFPVFMRWYRLIFYPIYILSYKDLRNSLPNIVRKKPEMNRSTILSFFVSVILGLAYIFPVWLAMHFSEMRMLASYSGQVLNFVATALALALLEPTLYYHLDQARSSLDGDVSKVAVDIIFGKIFSQVALVVACMTI